MAGFARRVLLFLLLWHVCWRVFFRGVLLQGGFDTPDARFFITGFATDLAVILPLFVSLLLVRAISPRLGTGLFLFVGFVLTIGLIFFPGYFQVFEKPAEFAVAGSGLGTIAGEFLHSALREISSEIGWYALGMLASFGAIVVLEAGVTRLRRAVAAAGIMSPIAGVAAGLMVMSFPVSATRDAPRWQGNEHTNPFVYAVERLMLRSSRVEREPETGSTQADWQSHSVFKNDRLPAIGIKRSHYNVIFYIMESTSARYAGMQVHGRQVMPVFQKLAQNAMVSRRHYSQFPLSVNARYSALMSAYNPLNKNWLPLSEPDFPAATIFETLKSAGYRTGILHTASLENWNYRKFLAHRNIDFQAEMRDMDKARFSDFTGFSIDDRAYIEPALDFIARSKEEPWFLTFLPVMPHHPYTMPFPELALYSQQEIDSAPGRAERLLRQYLNSLHYADHCLGELVAGLEKLGVLDDTLLFVFADHGEAFYQHSGNYLHALELYEENVHVPFLVYNRRLFPQPVYYQGISRHIDIAPTAVDMLGLRIPESFTGISLIRSHRPRLAYFHTDWEHDISGVRDGDWKYVFRMGEGRAELYNLETDPEEKKNLAVQHPDVVAKLHKELVAARQKQRAWYLSNRSKKL